MDSDRRKFAERRLSIVRNKNAHGELMQSPVYRNVYEHAISLIDKGHDPVMVTMAFASVTSAMLEMIHESARQRPSNSQTSDRRDGPR